MASATLQQAPEAPEKVNSFGRIVGVIFSPKETFESIARQPTWLVPVIFVTIHQLCDECRAGVIAWIGLPTSETQMERTGRTDQSSQRAGHESRRHGSSKSIRYVRGVIGDIFSVLFGAAIFSGSST